MQNFDLHMHTTYCDGLDSAEAMVLSAIENGLSFVGLSGHSFTPHDQSYCMSREGTERYIEEVRALKQKYADRITLLLGTELDRYADIDLSPYDYYIGSVHYIFSDEGKRKRSEILARHAGGAANGAPTSEVEASDAEMEALVKYKDWSDVDDCAEDLCAFAFRDYACIAATEHAANDPGQADGTAYSNTDPDKRKELMLAAAELYFDTVGGIIEATNCDIVGHFDLLTKFTEGWCFGSDGRIIKKPHAESAASQSGMDGAPVAVTSNSDSNISPFFDTSDERYIAAWKKAVDRIFDDCAERYKNGFRNRLEKLGVLDVGDKPVFEINTGAISKGYRTVPYPSADQIKYIKSKGGILILSSDSHAAGTICYGFEEIF